MSIESLTQGDTVVKQVAAHAIGPSGDDIRTWSGSTPLACTIQTMGGRESQKYAALGFAFTYLGLFSSDPGLSVNHRLKWTVKAGVALAVPVYLRVLACYSEGPPGEDRLWVVDLGQETTENPG